MTHDRRTSNRLLALASWKRALHSGRQRRRPSQPRRGDHASLCKLCTARRGYRLTQWLRTWQFSMSKKNGNYGKYGDYVLGGAKRGECSTAKAFLN